MIKRTLNNSLKEISVKDVALNDREQVILGRAEMLLEKYASGSATTTAARKKGTRVC